MSKEISVKHNVFTKLDFKFRLIVPKQKLKISQNVAM